MSLPRVLCWSTAFLMLAGTQFASAAPSATPAPSQVKIIARGDGVMFADASGMALYTFDGDEATPGKSSCNGPCAQQWPPLTAPFDAKALGLWSLIRRADGSQQWAFNGAPLYTFSAEGGPDTSFGDGQNNRWHLAYHPIWVPPGVSLQQTKLGTVVADAHGMTLYTSDVDASPGKSKCTDSCLQDWLPLIAPALANGNGDWSVITRDDSRVQWTFRGKPLYLSARDVAVGEVSGDRAGGKWHALVLEPAPPKPSWVTLQPSLAGETMADARGMPLYYRARARLNRGQSGSAAGGECETATCMGSEWIAVLADQQAKAVGNWTILSNAKDGTQQWAYRGYRVYTHSKDRPGVQFLGIRFGGDRSWSTIMGNGSPIQNM